MGEYSVLTLLVIRVLLAGLGVSVPLRIYEGVAEPPSFKSTVLFLGHAVGLARQKLKYLVALRCAL